MDSGNKNKRICFAHLPDDYLYMIYEKLDKKTDRDSFGLTCHRFLDIQNSSLKHLTIRKLPLLSCSHRPLFHPSTITTNDSLVMGKLLNRYRNLHSLHVFNTVQLSGLGSISLSYSLLSVISVCNSCIKDNGLKVLAESCTGLKQVDLGWCTEITDLGIGYLTRNCRQLRALRISGCYRIVGINELLSGGGLKYLNLSFPIIHNWGHELGAIGLGFGANIKILDFQNCSLVDDDIIHKISKGCPLLKLWNLSYCHKVEFFGWMWIAMYCKKVEILELNGCTNLCDSDLLVLGIGCNRLSRICVTNCKQITQLGIFHFKERRPDVKIEKKVVEPMVTPSWAFAY